MVQLARIAGLFAALAAPAISCSNLLVSKGASKDGSTILSYNADDTGLFGSIDLRPAASHPPGAMRPVWVRHDIFHGITLRI